MPPLKFSAPTSNVRLDVTIRDELGLGRTQINKLIKDGLVLINDVAAKKQGILLSAGDIITINESTKVVKQVTIKNKIDIPIIYEDDDVIVISKPKGVLAHPTNYDTTQSVSEVLASKIKVNEFQDKVRAGIVQRLDRNTTGLMVVAKNIASYNSLVEQINKRILKRVYVAIAEGDINEDLIVKLPIERKSNSSKMFVSDNEQAKYAETHIKVLAHLVGATLIECELKTGRTHQIRVHLSFLHHPIYNDSLYGTCHEPSYEQFLHCNKLSFIHPASAKPLFFEQQPDEHFQAKVKELSK